MKSGNNRILLCEKIIPGTNNKLHLGLILHASFFGTQTGHIIELTHLECEDLENETYNASGTEYFAPSDMETAMTAFQYRFENPRGAWRPSGLGSDVEGILGSDKKSNIFLKYGDIK